MKTTALSSRPVSFPYVLKFTDIHLYLFVALFVAMDVTVPWLCHWIHPLAGAIFLPMFFFILLAGLLFGWRAGLLVGIMTPIISYGISSMPDPIVLPRILVQAMSCGFVAGFFMEQRRHTVFRSVIGAMVIGHVAAGLAILILYGGAENPFDIIWKAAKMGLPGILLQLTLLPLLYKYVEQLFSKFSPSDAA
jgi:uncharacterized membrane protein